MNSALKQERKLLIFLIKLFHSLIYLLMSGCVSYLFYAGITRNYDWKLVVAVSMIGLEFIVLLLNRKRCPLTLLAKRLGDETGDDLIADYLLPRWAVPLTIPFCTLLVAVGLILIAFNALNLTIGFLSGFFL